MGGEAGISFSKISLVIVAYFVCTTSSAIEPTVMGKLQANYDKCISTKDSNPEYKNSKNQVNLYKTKTKDDLKAEYKLDNGHDAKDDDEIEKYRKLNSDSFQKNIDSVDQTYKDFEQFKSIEKHITPVRDQDSIGICYAFTSSDLINFKMSKNGITCPGKTNGGDLSNPANVISPYEMGLETEKYNVGKFLDAGNTEQKVLEDTLKRGVCFEDQLPSSDQIFTEAPKADEKEPLHFDEIDKKYLKPSEISMCSRDRRISDLYKTFNDPGKCIADKESAASKLFKLDLKDINTILNENAKNDSKALNELVKKACEKKCKPSEFGSMKPKTEKFKAEMEYCGSSDHIYMFDNEGKEKQQKLITSLDSKLRSGNIAAASISARSFFNFGSGIGYEHSVLVAGKVLDENCKPRYLIKNSWGKDSCAMITNKSVTCIDGYLMMTENDFASSILSYTTLE